MHYGQTIVVDDCSSDNTGELARKAGAIVLRHEKNIGYDGALNSGFKKASSNGSAYVITFDADGQHDPLLLKDFINSLDKCDVVLGIRPKSARLAENIFALYTRLYFDISDPLCGMKGYRMPVYHAQGCFDDYGSIGTQLALNATINGYTTCQIPVPVYERSDPSRFGARLSANMRIIRAMLIFIWRQSKFCRSKG